jgi:RNAse (barnase) inhibitor barstar
VEKAMDAKSKRLADAKLCGVFQLTVEPYEIEREAKAAGLAVFRMDIGHAHGKKDFLALIAKAMKFPDHFGGNWDALNDCLTDLEWLDGKGWVLVFEKSKHFGAGHQHEFDEAMEVLRAAAEYWKADGKPFWAFVHGAQGWDCGLPKWPANG